MAAFAADGFPGSDGPGDRLCRGEVILGLPAAGVLPHVRGGVVEESGPGRAGG